MTRRILIFAGCVLVSFAISDAKAFWIGAHGGYSNGGDVNEDATGFGLQAGGRINDTFSLEISGTHFKDSAQGVSLDITSVGVTGLAGVDVIKDTARLYAGAGLDYNMFDGRIDILEIEAASQGMSVDDYAAANGFSVADMRSFIQDAGISADVRFHDAVGCHVCAGAAVNINEGLQVFAQYRYTWTKMKGDITYSLLGQTGIEKDAIDLNYKFGLFMVGVNIIL